jgi:LDH2 family malate/lactate/ureidoglycolate dehydrogenase
MTVQKVAHQPSAIAAVANCGHTGRIGAFAETIARAGCFALVLGGGGHERFKSVVPYGGREGALSTNPYALALPGGPTDAVVVDFATSATAQGKVLYAKAAGTPLPEGLIIDKQGRPSRNAEDYFAGGFLLPAAGPKGYGLGLIAELLGYGLLDTPRELNWILFAFDLEAFGGQEAYRERTESYLAWVKDRAPAPGFDEVMVPGEPEQRCRKARLAGGIPVPPEIRADLCAWAGRLGVDLAGVPGLDWTGTPS